MKGVLVFDEKTKTIKKEGLPKKIEVAEATVAFVEEAIYNLENNVIAPADMPQYLMEQFAALGYLTPHVFKQKWQKLLQPLPDTQLRALALKRLRELHHRLALQLVNYQPE